MRCVREILRLRAEGLSDRAIARLARSTVGDYAGRAVAARLSWPLPEGLTDTALEALLFVRVGPAAGARRKPEPDWPNLHLELRRAGVTLMLLWQEYRAGAPEGYGYSRFCELYEAWESRLSPTMRQVHPAGERLFVDYAGQTVELVDGRTCGAAAPPAAATIWWQESRGRPVRHPAARMTPSASSSRCPTVRRWRIAAASSGR